MFYVTSEIYLNNDLGSLAVSVDNYPQKRKNHLTITYKIIKVVKYLLVFLRHLLDLVLKGWILQVLDGLLALGF